MIKAFIVDDEKWVRKGLLLTIPWQDYNIEIIGEANDGEEALRFMQHNEIQLLFTDLTMPNLSGFELMRRARKQFPQMAIVILTCHQDFDYIQEALRLGAIDYIVKTQLEIEKIDEVMSRIIGRITERSTADLVPKPDIRMRRQKLEQLAERMGKLFWLFDQNEFEQMIADLEGLTLSNGQLRELFHNVSIQWNRIHHLAPCIQKLWLQVESFTYWYKWEQWLLEIRSVFSRQITLNLNCSHEITICLLKALDYIESHISSDLKQSQIVKEINMSRGYFSECFKDFVGINFVDYVKSVRINKAKALLRENREPIYLVAEKTGFQDVKYFSKVFKEVVGVLPSVYRILREQEEARVGISKG
jgi:two-component system response regulator YesN